MGFVKSELKKAKAESTLNQLHRLKYAAILIACWGAGFIMGIPYLALSIPGGADDPFVTKAWVDKYVKDAFDPLSQSIADLADEIIPNNQLVLYIGKKEALINEEPVSLDAAPQIVDGSTMLPLRFIGENLKAKVDWDNRTKTVTCQKGGKTVILKLNDKLATVNGEQYTLVAAPLLDNSRVLIPARFVAEAFGAEVKWDDVTKRVTIK